MKRVIDVVSWIPQILINWVVDKWIGVLLLIDWRGKGLHPNGKNCF